MACCCNLKNPHYKSVLEAYNSAAQTLTATAAPLNLGATVTDTGCALSLNGSAVNVRAGGTYQIDGDVNVTATGAGTVTVQMYLNGVALPETLRTISVAAGQYAISTRTARYIAPNCANVNSLTLQASGAGVTVDLTSVRVVRLA